VDSDVFLTSQEVNEPYDLAVLVNPITIRALASTTNTISELGDYATVITSGSSPTTETVYDLPLRWNPISADQFLHVNSSGTIFFSFGSNPARLGDYVGIETIMHTSPNACYIISADVQDWYDATDIPWVLLQQLVVNDIVLWSHDVSAADGCWQRIHHFLMPTSNEMHIQLRVVAISNPMLPIDWEQASLSGIRGLLIERCD